MTEKDFDKRIQSIENKLDNFLSLVSERFAPTACHYSFYEWLQEWFATYKASELSDGGYDMRNSIDKHIKPNIADMPLNKVNALLITKALNKVNSSRMRQIVRCIYSQAFTKAYELDIIAENPIRKVSTVKHKQIGGRALTVSEQKQFLRKAEKSELKLLFHFYLLTGCRRSEALNIKWTDIKNGMLCINGTKTDKAVRTLPLYGQLKNLLKEIPHNSELLFPYKVGRVYKNFCVIRSKLKFQDFTIHDLRHTFATRCLESGISMKTVQKWLGHSKYDTTANIYSHVSTEFEKSEVKKLKI
jgi:integrase